MLNPGQRTLSSAKIKILSPKKVTRHIKNPSAIISTPLEKNSTPLPQKKQCLQRIFLYNFLNTIILIVLLNKLLESPKINKEHTNYLYQCAKAHSNLPNLTPAIKESDENFHMRAKYALQNSIMNSHFKPIKLKKIKITKFQSSNRSKEFIESDLQDIYQQAENLAEIQRDITISKELFNDCGYSPIATPKYKSEINTLTNNSPTSKSQNPHITRCFSEKDFSDIVKEHQEMINKKNEIKNQDEKAKLFLESCKSVEKTAVEQEKIFTNHAKKINSSFDSMKFQCKFINEDKLPPYAIRRFSQINNKGKLYNALEERKNNLINSQNTDIQELFKKIAEILGEQSSVKGLGYMKRLAKYSNEQHKKEHLRKKKVKANSYLIYAEKFIQKLNK